MLYCMPAINVDQLRNYDAKLWGVILAKGEVVLNPGGAIHECPDIASKLHDVGARTEANEVLKERQFQDECE